MKPNPPPPEGETLMRQERLAADLAQRPTKAASEEVVQHIRHRKDLAGILGVLLLLAVAPLPTRAFPRPGATELISEASGVPSPISANGQFVVFVRDPRVFVRDRVTGATELVSVASDGSEANEECASPVISADGRYVAFWSAATNLVPGDTNGTSDVFVHDRVTHMTERVSLTSDGSQTTACFGPAISGDGRYVTFWTDAPNVVSGDTNGAWDVFVRDRVAGTTERVSVASDGTEANSFSFGPAISADGRYVGFMGPASNLVPGDTNGSWDTFIHDRVTGITERVSVASDGTQSNGFSRNPVISADGRYVAFYSTASNLVPGDTNGVETGLQTEDVFVHDRATGATERVSVASDGAEANGSSDAPAISANGRFVVFYSDASNLVPEDTNGAADAFVHDRTLGTTERVSVNSDGSQANSGSYTPAISDDGRYVAFLSYAHLIPGEPNGVFVHDRGGSPGILGPLSVNIAPEGLTVSGVATFSGAVISSVNDPTGDDVPGLLGRTADTDLTGASLIYRQEQNELFVRLSGVTAAASVEHCTVDTNFITVCENGGGAPGAISPGSAYRRTLYGMGFKLDGVSFEIRARAKSTFIIETAGQTETFVDPAYLALYRCDPVCTEQTLLQGGMGTTGVELWVFVPLSALGTAEGAALTEVRAFTAQEEANLQARETIDAADLPDGAIPIHSVSLGVAPAGTPESQVVFNTTASLTGSSFLGTIARPEDYTVWARPCLGIICGPAVSWSSPVALVGIVSRKTHGSAGTFDIDLPLNGNSGIECRSGQPNAGDHMIVFTFPFPVTFASADCGGTPAAASADGNSVMVNCLGVTNAQTISITVHGVSAPGFATADAAISMGVLLGDTTANGSVNSSDIGQAKSNSGQTTAAANYRTDVTVNGAVNSSDIGTIKAQSGTSLP